MTTHIQPRRTQQERREQTIARLVDATIECLVKDGYSGTTVKAVAARAGLSQGAIFRHFPTRLELLMATMNTVADRFIQGYQQRVADFAAQGFVAFQLDFSRLHNPVAHNRAFFGGRQAS